MNIKINENFNNIKETYLFSEIGARVRKYAQQNPDKEIIRMGIGDVTLPLPSVVVNAMTNAALEMGNKETFRGYPPEYGYDFLREAIANHYTSLGVDIPSDSIFVSDGAKSDLGNFLDILGQNKIIIPDPVYPVYVDSNTMNGNDVIFVNGTKENGFLPAPTDISDKNIDGAVIYICSPNNPTGACYNYDGLKAWVDFAIKTQSLILYDSAYEAFVDDANIPHTIYEIPGGKDVAVEICSFSKFAGFTGVRCGWTVVPDTLVAGDTKLNKLWKRRQATKFNGVSYPVQRAAEAALSEEGIKECQKNITYYKRNAQALCQLLDSKGIFYTGGKNSPYVWLKCPDNMGSWEFFDKLLTGVQIVGTPGEGFGANGEGYFRLTAFGTYENTLKACKRLEGIL